MWTLCHPSDQMEVAWTFNIHFIHATLFVLRLDGIYGTLLFFRALLAKILLRRPITIRLYANLHLKFVLERASNIMILTIQLCLWSSLQHDLEIVRLILLLWYCVNQHPCNLGHREGLGPTIRMLFIGVKVFFICCCFQLLLLSLSSFQVLGAILLFGEGALEASPNLLLSLYIILSDWERGWWGPVYWIYKINLKKHSRL